MNSYVTCCLFGQLGNQLFQIATTLAYAWDYGAIPVFPELHKQEDRISYNKDRIFFRLDASSPPKPFRELFQEKVYYSAERVPYREDLVLYGHFQSWKHFHHHRERILDAFAPSNEVQKKLESKYASLLSGPDTVGVHLRTHSKHLHEDGSGMHPFSGFQFFRDAMALFPGALFVIFSDRIEWCKRICPQEFPGKELLFIEGNDGIEDLFLFSMLRHQIFGNSTYGWWGAYLNRHPERQVVSPKHWRDPARYGELPIEDLALPDWTLLPVGFSHPYPEGLENESTTSVNN